MQAFLERRPVIRPSNPTIESPVANLESLAPTRGQFVASQLEGMLSLPVIPDDIESDLALEPEGRKYMGPIDIELSDDAIMHQATAVTTLLRGVNASPSDSDIEVLSSAIRRLEGGISRSDHSLLLHQLQANTILRGMRSLKAERTRLQRNQDLFKSYLAPLRRLPAETLAHVFSYHMYEEIQPPTQPTLMHVAQVCRSWRNAALGCAILWTCLSIKIQEGAYSAKLAVRRLPPLWYANAKDLPLKFCLDAPFYNFPKRALLDRLLPFFPRLSELRLKVDGLDNEVFDLPHDTFSQLKTLSLIRNYTIGSGKAIEIFGSAPALRSVTLDIGPGNILQPSESLFPWSQITSLDILEDLTPPEWFSIFSQCVQLQTALFFIQPHEAFTPSSRRIITFEHLTTLTIGFRHGAHDIGRLKNLRFPALRDLRLVAGSDDIPVDRFLQTFPTPSLRCFYLARAGIKINSLIRFLSSCDALEELGIDLLQYYGELFEAMRNGVGKMSSGPALPNLTSFVTCVAAEIQPQEGEDEDEEDDDSSDISIIQSAAPLADLLRWWSRHPPHLRRLRNVKLFSHRYIDIYTGDDHDDIQDKAEVFLDDLKTRLQGCVYDDTHCPEGFTLQTSILNTEEVDFASPLIGFPE
ncbi:hypothetical protein FPV67DRAFT_1778712 [Lyophyllum atratum]|nr:hypothetical protein FPV67DRAFT_1778712 [Lyophyllum atratum]